MYRSSTFDCGRFSLDLNKRTHIMGVLNVTPDSFSDGGRFSDPQKAVRHAIYMQKTGADIIDIGAESTRPGSRSVVPDVQIARLRKVVKILSRKLTVPISIDTSNFKVAKACLDEGAAIINDVTGLKKDPLIAKLVADYGAGLIVMHMKKTPAIMQDNPKYCNLMEEIKDSLRHSVNIAKKLGVKSNSIIIDPGIGFGKTLKHNLTILKRLRDLHILKKPILIGTSRKSFIGQILNRDVSHRLYGTLATIVISIINGASVVRVHDVEQVKDAVLVADKLLSLKG